MVLTCIIPTTKQSVVAICVGVYWGSKTSFAKFVSLVETGPCSYFDTTFPIMIVITANVPVGDFTVFNFI